MSLSNVNIITGFTRVVDLENHVTVFPDIRY